MLPHAGREHPDQSTSRSHAGKTDGSWGGQNNGFRRMRLSRAITGTKSTKQQLQPLFTQHRHILPDKSLAANRVSGGEIKQGGLHTPPMWTSMTVKDTSAKDNTERGELRERDDA